MLGIIVQLAISWVIIRVVEKQNLSVLGFFPTKQRLLDFFIFFFITAACCAAGFLLKMYFGQPWSINPKLSAALIFEGILWNIKSVLFEELIFRGVILYIMIKRIGSVKGIIISAIAFGIYHWFSFGIIGNVTQMIIVFFITGIMGLLLAYGYAKTFSLYIPIAIHLGWNLTQNFIFSQGPIGNGIFVPGSPFRTDSYFIFYGVTFLPLIVMLIANFLLLRRRQGYEHVKRNSRLPANR
jgi:uncharacterized protein